MRDEAKWTLGGIACGFVVVAVIVIIALVVESTVEVKPNQYAIRYGKYNMKLYPTILSEGKHTVGVSDRLITFPSNFIDVAHEEAKVLTCYTRDKTELRLSIVFQYSYVKEKLISFLLEYGHHNKIHLYITQISRDSLRDVCSQYGYSTFFNNRTYVEQAMKSNLVNDLAFMEHGVNIGFLQLKNVALPQQLMDAIEAKETALQSVTEAENDREVVLTNADTDLQTAKADKDIALVAAQAEYNSIVQTAQTTAAIDFKFWQERANAWSLIQTQLNMNGTDFLSYLRFSIVS